MTNHFRQLILSVLPVLGMLLLLSGSWFRYEAVTQQKAQIQQFVAVLQVSLRPYLSSESTAPITALMNNAQYVSSVPVEAVMLLNKSGEMMTSTVSHYVVSPEWLRANNTGFQLYKQHGKLVAVQPLFNSSDTDINHAGQHYLVMIFADMPLWQIWLLPIILLIMTAWYILFMVKQQQQRNFSRLQTDIGFIAHKLQQGHWVAATEEPVVAELQPIIQQLNQLPLWSKEAAPEPVSVEHKPSLLQQNEQLYAELTGLSHKTRYLQQQQQQWLGHYQQLLQHYPELKTEDFIRYSQQQLLFARLCLDDQALAVTQLLPTAWLAQQLVCWQADAQQKKVDIQLIESEDLLRYQLRSIEPQLSQLLSLLVSVCLRTVGITELTIRSTVTHYQTDNAAFGFTLTTNGQGLTEREIKLLSGEPEQLLQWDEADIGCIQLLLQQLNVAFSVHCLSGIGCTLQLNIPVVATPLEFTCPLEQLLVFDSALTVLNERKSALSALAVNTHFSVELADLEKKQAATRYDMVLIFLPDISELPRWTLLIQTLRKNSLLLCYAKVQDIALWQNALQFPVMVKTFCLEHIMQLVKQQQRLPHLLVVDDNQINLSFVQVLLKHKAVKLTLADTGYKALELCQQQHFDAVLLDIQLPDISGVEVASQLRLQTAYSKTPILAFTAHASEHEQDTFKAAGMDAVIIKPLEAEKADTILGWCQLGLRQQHYAG